jgi:RNA polymerase sigma factor (TIGR02999 family)
MNLSQPPGEFTRLLQNANEGEPAAVSRLVPLVYEELRHLARLKLRREQPGHTLTPTALIHEAYAKLAAGSEPRARDRAHFLAIASRAMRQVLVEHARSRSAQKRDGGWMRTTLAEGLAGKVDPDPTELIALDEALEQLPVRQRQVVECRVFGGMEEREIALALGISERTVRRDWVGARARLILLMSDGEDPRMSSSREALPSDP